MSKLTKEDFWRAKALFSPSANDSDEIKAKKRSPSEAWLERLEALRLEEPAAPPLCDQPCRKCGSGETKVRFWKKGAVFEDIFIGHTEYDPAFVEPAIGNNLAVLADMLAHRCERCGYGWQTVPADAC